MKTNNGVENRTKVTRRLILSSLIVLAFAMQSLAQTDTPYVIKVKKGNVDHYLAHGKSGNTWVVQDATQFGPNCIWHSGTRFNPSGTNHNYYFNDGEGEGVRNFHFLAAPFEPLGQPTLSDSLIPTTVLRNSDQMYYFYDWDADAYGRGVARGHQHTGLNHDECDNEHYSWGSDECWEVYWLECNNSNQWRLTSASYYTINTGAVPNAARFRPVTVTEHPKQLTDSTGGVGNLAGFDMDYSASPLTSHGFSVSASAYSYTYIPAYTSYGFEGTIHNFFNNADQGTDTPNTVTSNNNTVSSYAWTVTGPGAAYLSFSNTSPVTTASIASPTLYYLTENATGHKTATVTLTVTYSDNSTQVRTATVNVKTRCQNPVQTTAPVVTYSGVTVSWARTSNTYTLSWKKKNGTEWTSINVGDVVSYTIAGLDYETEYQYKVTTSCDTGTPTIYSFTTSDEPGLYIGGAVFGGGRMANVGGNTEVVVINCDTIGAVFGGNDLAGEVQGAKGATITLGVDAGDDYDTYGTTDAEVRIGSVYGGGNGYYAYDGTGFAPASYNTVYHVASGASVNAMTQGHQVGDVVWTNTANATADLQCPKIQKAAITVANDYVKVDSLFGGAKNAILSAGNTEDVTVTINGGTLYAVYGGNNFGGSLGYRAQERIVVNGTTTNLTPNIVNTATTGYGHDFGIRYLFGGGNRASGQNEYVEVKGGQIDNLFGGGNAADVSSAHVTVNCDLGTQTASGVPQFGQTLSQAIEGYTSGTLTIDDDYDWDGTGVYNVRNLYGGNNEAAMAGVPEITLTSGSVGTVYGGGNAGDMLAQETGIFATEGNDDIEIKYSTHVTMNSDKMLVDYLYGGCRMSNVDYSTWVELKKGHVGTVYGGCNVSGDVGSTRVNLQLEPIDLDDPNLTPEEKKAYFLAYQQVQGATYVKATGGTVYNNLFAGSNGFYHCNDGIHYVECVEYGGQQHCIDYGDPEHLFLGMSIPTHNETHVVVSKDAVANTAATVKGNVYAGGNLACVGFINATMGDNPFPKFVGLSSVQVDGGTIDGSVFGGGNMASIYGSNEVRVKGGTIRGALYGGNDRTGAVADITSRVLPDQYNYASDKKTSLTDVRTYISLTGRPDVGTVYGGGNGDYDYEHGEIPYCDPTDQPIQSNTFVDVNIDGFTSGTEQGGHIETVYGGGNGVTVKGTTTVLLNVKGENGAAPVAYDHVSTIFGGNNKGSLDILPNIILLNGQVNTVYGGCNQGAMTGSNTVTIGDSTYQHVGSMVHLRHQYVASDSTMAANAVVSGAVYGGCRMNGVDHNSLVVMEDGNHSNATLFGGSDISGDISGLSRVVVTGGTASAVYGAGNGNYTYTGDLAGLDRPNSANARVDILGGSMANLYGGGYAGNCGTSTVTMNGGSVSTGVYGGCNASGTVTGPVKLSVNGGQVGTDASHKAYGIFGGGYGTETGTGDAVTVTIGNNADLTPTIFGDVYGGSAKGNVNAAVGEITKVWLKKGTVYGDIYGGGFGDDNQEALVNGSVQVVVDGGTVNATGTTGGRVFGGNNLMGTPKGTVEVTINETNATVVEGGVKTYALKGVYGGGNQADYQPTNTNNGTPRVIVDCNTSIEDVYGGANAADVPQTDVTILGGDIKRVFAGGNGALGAADVTGTASALIKGGTITQVFGGSNTEGAIGDQVSLTINKEGSCAMKIGEVFGGGNLAEGKAGNITIGCTGTWTTTGENNHTNHNGTTNRIGYELEGIGTVYGGANQANIGTTSSNSNISLNITSGIVENVYGGNNISGDINGTITVNINKDDSVCDWYVGDVYGGGNHAEYGGTPNVNIMAGTVSGNVYGGGNDITNDSDSHPVGVLASNVEMTGGTVLGGLYGGCNHKGSVTTDALVKIYGGTVGADGALANVFGGGLGQHTNVKGNVNVTVDQTGTDAPVIWGNVYGGSALGEVNSDDSNTTTVDFINGTLHGNLFGGGLGQASPAISAEVYGNVTVNVGKSDGTGNGTVDGNVFGGNNFQGSPKADITVNMNKGTTTNIFGGGNLAACTGTPTVNLNGGTVAQSIYGGSNEANSAGTLVNINNGTVGTGIYGGCNTTGTVTGNIAVNVYGGTLGTSDTDRIVIYGGGYGPSTQSQGDVTVSIGDGSHSPTIYGDIYGGSALGAVNASDKTTTIDFNDGTLNGVLYGGGTGRLASDTDPTITAIAAMVNGDVDINVNGGTLPRGIFGGCNLNGTVGGDIAIDVTEGTIGVQGTPANIHGGGYGALTATNGNVTVTFGEVATDHSDAPVIYGDIFGGSALGNVNNDADDNTTINIHNGTINGDVYGGGLGNSDHAAQVNGKVYVNIGAPGATPIGKAKFNNSVIYGCNSVNGSPQDDVFVNVYQTAHTEKDAYDYLEDDRTYAIHQVFGGGNEAHYTPVNATKKITTYIHGCENTIYRVFGGGNSADAMGVSTTIDGGRFDFIYGGGNGEFGTPANIGDGGVNLAIHGGHIGAHYTGSNMNGTIHGNITETVDSEGGCGELVVEYYFCGANEAEIVGDVTTTIRCDQNMKFKYLYGGSNLADITGDVNLTVEGGEFENVFGGSRGDANHASRIGGDVNLTLKGGKIGNVYGGNDLNGNIEGKITVTVEDAKDATCPLSIENIFGGSNKTNYEPATAIAQTDSPSVNVFNGTVNGNVYGGGNEADVTSNPKVTIGHQTNTAYEATVGGNVYGGGNAAHVQGDTKVILQGKANIGDNVYGGGKHGDVNGSTNVIIVPQD